MKHPIGVGLRHTHFPYLLEKPETKVSWFEAITENFLQTEGRPMKVLEKIREDYPVALHGVSLSIGASEELDYDYLKKVKNLYQRIDPLVVSDHLCWTGHQDNNLHNLLPIPYTDSVFNFIADRVSKVQDFYGRTLALENLSAYFTLKESTMSEAEFLVKLTEKTGCKILLDINNIYVNSVNQKFDPKDFLDKIRPEMIAEVHLAGFSDMGTHLFDTHSKPVYPAVWDLFAYKVKDLKDTPILIEWDEDIPEFEVLQAEALKALEIYKGVHGE